MPEETGQQGGTLAFTTSFTTTSSNVAALQGISHMDTPQQGSISFHQSLSSGEPVQSDSFEVGGAFAPGDQTVVTLTKAGQATDYVNQVQTGETFEAILDNLVSRINLDVDVAADYTYTGTVGAVTLKSATGENYTVAVTSSGGMTTSTVTSISTGSGAAALKMRKLGEVTVNYSLNSQGNPQVQDTYKFFDGAETPALVQSLTLSAQVHPLNIIQLQQNNGA